MQDSTWLEELKASGTQVSFCPFFLRAGQPHSRCSSSSWANRASGGAWTEGRGKVARIRRLTARETR